MTVFRDRSDAGRQLAAALTSLPLDPDVVVLGLPRGGVPVAAEVARRIEAPLDVLVVRKLSTPRQPELAWGAIGECGVRVLDDVLQPGSGLGEAEMAAIEAEERVTLVRRVEQLRRGRPPLSLVGRTAVVVDDGAATGSTARAACLVTTRLGAAHVVVALPVASARALAQLEEVADEVVCLVRPDWFWAVSRFYQDFSEVCDDEVDSCLAASRQDLDPPPGEHWARAVP